MFSIKDCGSLLRVVVVVFGEFLIGVCNLCWLLKYEVF